MNIENILGLCMIISAIMLVSFLFYSGFKPMMDCINYCEKTGEYGYTEGSLDIYCICKKYDCYNETVNRVFNYWCEGELTRKMDIGDIYE